MDWFEEGDIICFTSGMYRGAIGVVKEVCDLEYDMYYYVLIEGDEDNRNNYRGAYNYDIGYVYHIEIEDEALPDKTAFQPGDVVNTPDGIQAVREVIIEDTGEAAKYMYETSPLDLSGTVCRYGEASLEFQYHDTMWKEYFTESAQNDLPEWRGELYNLDELYSERFYYDGIYYNSDYYWGDGFNDIADDYSNDTLPPRIMKYILKEYTIDSRINAVLAPRKNAEEIGKILNLKPKESYYRWSIISKIYDLEKKSGSMRKSRFTDSKLALAISEIDKRDVIFGRSRKHFPIHMTDMEIMKSIREAYHTARKISRRRVKKSFVTRFVVRSKAEPIKGSALYEGVSKNGLAIQFRYNFDMGIIETAYPIEQAAP